MENKVLYENQFDAVICTSVYFPKYSFELKKSITSGELQVELAKNSKRDNDKLTASLECSICNDKEEFTFFMLVVGKFKLIENINPEDIDTKTFEIKALDMLFPYLRNQVALVTTQPGFTPISLPPYSMRNFVEMEEQERQKNTDQ